METVKALICGVGSIGSLIAAAALRTSWVDVVAAVDVDERKIGQDLGNILGCGRLGITVEGNLAEALSSSRPDIVLHATSSFLDQISDQVIKSINFGVDFLSTCETLVYPYYRYPRLADKINRLAVNRGVSVVGGGVNPGFLLDLLPGILSSLCLNIRRIHAVRLVDSSRRREAFRKKIGVGLSLKEYEEMREKNLLTGHVGYAESTLLLADMLGIKLEEVRECQRPLIKSGRVIGLEGVGLGYLKRREIIRVMFKAMEGGKEYDEIVIEGEPNIIWRSEGVQGELATAALIINLIPRVLEAEPGIQLVSRLKPPSHRFMAISPG